MDELFFWLSGDYRVPCGSRTYCSPCGAYIFALVPQQDNCCSTMSVDAFCQLFLYVRGWTVVKITFVQSDRRILANGSARTIPHCPPGRNGRVPLNSEIVQCNSTFSCTPVRGYELVKAHFMAEHTKHPLEPSLSAFLVSSCIRASLLKRESAILWPPLTGDSRLGVSVVRQETLRSFQILWSTSKNQNTP